ncbi:hypothetical protein SCHPADRAFT_831061 [Schizopora paradoxa]|uniref:non-specific serine/threonine protein kinase n=1 Tax=Schizopora paradoxa TaxID=27342 RepID=A0A0H2RIM4_9AGAM|nr:hypothetical protein SCHPADRAFT_831061 [Schizopora paradoxa]
MESIEEQQKAEIEVLKSIYSEDFIESPPPKAWKVRGAVRQPEFTIKVAHPNARYQAKLYAHLNVKFPKAYPAKATPLFAVVPPIAGISHEQTVALSNSIHAESRKFLGSEMVFQIVTFCQEWIEANVSLPLEGIGSLAKEMEARNLEVRKSLEEQEHARMMEEHKRAQALEAEIMQQIEQDTRRKLEIQRQEKERLKARTRTKRAMSDATEKPMLDIATETFDQDIVISGSRFNSVKLFGGRNDCLGTTYNAEPIFEDVVPGDSVLLELHVISFESSYYKSDQGEKKLKQVDNELKKLVKITDKNVIKTYAAQLSFPESSDPLRLLILREQKPALTLHDILTDCDTLREERVSDYFAQILGGLNAIHASELVHRGICPKSIALVDRDDGVTTKGVKLTNVSYAVKLLDMHKSDPFGPKTRGDQSELLEFTDDWLPREAIESPLTYTRGRDLHAVGAVLLQMLMGLDVITRFPDAKAAIQKCNSTPLLSIATDLLIQSKKTSISCLSLLARLSQASQLRAPRLGTIATSSNGSESDKKEIYVEMGVTRQTSRWRDDWQELDELGSGGFGTVVKARNKIDERIYAGKPGEFDRGDKNDRKIFREVTALSRLNHQNIVRYYTTWVEEAVASPSNAPSDTESEDGQTVDGHRSSGLRERTRSGWIEDLSDNPTSFDLNDLDTTTTSGASFPSIHYTSGDVFSGSEDEGTDDEAEQIITNIHDIASIYCSYLRQEYVENQTLQERIAEGLDAAESMRLFHQIVDALVHMSNLGILHRDIKCTNIFIGAYANHDSLLLLSRFGDFGLATSSLAAVDPSDVSPHTASAISNDYTSDVGTTFYIAPEILSRRKGPKDHSKADMYSLGIVFFEMNYVLRTGFERVKVLQRLRQPEIIFPSDWDNDLTLQRNIITLLLQHDPSRRPSAQQLDKELPKKVEEEYFEDAIRMITVPDSKPYQVLLTSLFQSSPPAGRGHTYDEELPESSSLKGHVVERLTKYFVLHGARNVDVPLLMPKSRLGKQEDDQPFYLLDKNGEIVSLASNVLVPFARSAARTGVTRIKRYHIGEVYKNAIDHPKILSAAAFDIITTDLQDGPVVACVELFTLVYEIMKSFPLICENYVMRVSHLGILNLVFERIPKEKRDAVLQELKRADFTTGAGSTAWRNSLKQLGLIRSVLDDIETLSIKWDNPMDALERLDKNASVLSSAVKPYLEKIKQVTDLAKLSGISIDFMAIHPLPYKTSAYYQDDIFFEVVRRTKQTDIIVAGGRHDRLISKLTAPVNKREPFCAFAAQFLLDRIIANLVEFQKLSMLRLSAQRSYGYWSLRRCDVYVAAFQPGLLFERLELVNLLWKNGISADLMYEGSVPNNDIEDILDQCHREGILFTVFVKSKGARKEDLGLKIKNVLSGAETETTKQELVSTLQHLIAEQNRLELKTSGVSSQVEVGSPIKEIAPQTSSTSNVPLQVVLPGDVKKIRKQTKHIFTEKAYDTFASLKSQMQSGSLPMLAVDVVPAVFEAMAASNVWVSDDDAWRKIAAQFPTSHTGYANQIHEAVEARKEEGAEFLLLFSCKDDRTALVSLQ